MIDEADLGVSNERTALAWQRSALSLVAAAAIMVRLTWSDLGALSILPLGGAIVLSGWVFWESRGRYTHAAGTRLRARSRGGRAPAALTSAVILMALAELAALMHP